MDSLKSIITRTIVKIDLDHKKRLIVIFLDLILIAFCYFLAFLIRFEMDIPLVFLIEMLKALPIVIILRLICFWLFGLYKGMWRFASTEDLISILKATSISSILIVLSLYLINQFRGYPRSVFFIDWLLLVIFIGGFRFSIRLFKDIVHSNREAGKRTLIVGAGSAGESILHEMIKNGKLDYNPIGLIDDDPLKKGLKLHGIKVLGTREDIPEVAKNYGIEEIIISIPSATNTQIKDIIGRCIKSRAKFKTVPTLTEIINGELSASQIREVQMEDLLGREPLEIEMGRIRTEFSGSKVLVTGAGGSIGKELCRQISKFHPEELILFDHAENSVFYIDRDLHEDFPSLNCIPLVADVSDKKSTDQILAEHKPHVIFHAAAHKHVPLMELNAGEAVRNNVLGTKVISDLAVKHNVDKFIFISTDKAVNPKNFMGATKRIGELYVASLAQVNSTRFMSVRFGNVIGSTGSVVRLFKEQIQHGGPITVTHPKATRFLMTIPEAVQLILQATSMGQGGEIFVLDMGKPINIMDLAKTMISLSGFKPEKDIPIFITGLRSGEKLTEELFDDENERLKSTDHEKIYVVEDLNHIDYKSVTNALNELEMSAQELDKKKLIGKFQKLLQLDLNSSWQHD